MLAVSRDPELSLGKVQSHNNNYEKYATIVIMMIKMDIAVKMAKIQGVFYTGPPLKILKYGKPRLGASTLT